MWTIFALNKRIAAWRRRLTDSHLDDIDPSYATILSTRWPDDKERVLDLSRRYAALVAHLKNHDHGQTFDCIQVHDNRVRDDVRLLC